MDTWTKDANGEAFKSGLLAWDSDAKETVRISNGYCQRPHDRENYDDHMSDGTGCLYAPYEAIAVRVVGWVQTKRGATPRIAFTYRAVRPQALTVLRLADADSADRANRFPWPDDARFVTGRV